MMVPERMRFPALPAVAETANVLGVDATYARLNALLSYALGFASDADDGVWGQIYLVFGSGQRRVGVLVTHSEEGGYLMTLDETNETDAARFKAGARVWIGLDGWRLLAESFANGSHAGLREFLDSLNGSLTLLAKEVEDMHAVA